MEKNRIKRILLYIVSISAIIAVVMLIVNYVIKINKQEKAKEMQADLLAVQAKVEIIKGKNSVNKDENPLKGVSVSKVAEKMPVVNKLFEKHGITGDDVGKYYILRNSDLNEMELGNLVGKHPGTYIVNYDNFEVLYTLGYTNANGLFCFKVSEINKQPDVQKIVPVSSNETQETSAEATTETQAETTTETTDTTSENAETTEETQASVEVNEELVNAIKNNTKKLIK